MHDRSVSELYVPPAHSWQAAGELAPVAAWLLPASQMTHCSPLVSPGWVEYLPAAHSTHDPPPEPYLPGAQSCYHIFRGENRAKFSVGSFICVRVRRKPRYRLCVCTCARRSHLALHRLVFAYTACICLNDNTHRRAIGPPVSGCRRRPT